MLTYGLNLLLRGDPNPVVGQYGLFDDDDNKISVVKTFFLQYYCFKKRRNLIPTRPASVGQNLRLRKGTSVVNY